MREKRLMTVVSFPTTAEAMETEQCCRKNGLPGRLIPVPRTITAECGIAWSTPVEYGEQTRQVLAAAGVETEGWCELWL